MKRCRDSPSEEFIIFNTKFIILNAKFIIFKFNMIHDGGERPPCGQTSVSESAPRKPKFVIDIKPTFVALARSQVLPRSGEDRMHIALGPKSEPANLRPSAKARRVLVWPTRRSEGMRKVSISSPEGSFMAGENTAIPTGGGGRGGRAQVFRMAGIFTR